MREIGHLIDGKEVKGTSRHFADALDSNTGEVQAKAASAKHSEVAHAVATAAAEHAINPQRRARVPFRSAERVYAHQDRALALAVGGPGEDGIRPCGHAAAVASPHLSGKCRTGQRPFGRRPPDFQIGSGSSPTRDVLDIANP